MKIKEIKRLIEKYDLPDEMDVQLNIISLKEAEGIMASSTANVDDEGISVDGNLVTIYIIQDGK